MRSLGKWSIMIVMMMMLTMSMMKKEGMGFLCWSRLFQSQQGCPGDSLCKLIHNRKCCTFWEGWENLCVWRQTFQIAQLLDKSVWQLPHGLLIIIHILYYKSSSLSPLRIPLSRHLHLPASLHSTSLCREAQALLGISMRFFFAQQKEENKRVLNGRKWTALTNIWTGGNVTSEIWLLSFGCHQFKS